MSPQETVARRIYELHRRHAAAVCRVFDDGVDANKADIRNGSLPPDCLVSLVVGQRSEATSYPAPTSAPKMAEAPLQEIRMSIDEVGKRVIFERWGEIKGVGAELLIALAAPFREAREGELAPEEYPYLTTQKLARQLKCESERCCAVVCFGVEMKLIGSPRKPATLNFQPMPSSRAANGTAIGLIPIE